VPLGLGKSVVIELPRDVKEVLVADPLTANAVMRRPDAPISSGSKWVRPTSTSSDADGNQIGGLDIASRAQPQWHPWQPSSRPCPTQISRLKAWEKASCSTGHVTSPMDAQLAFDIASRLVEDSKRSSTTSACMGENRSC